MEGCACIEQFQRTDQLLVKYQYISDFFIALAYFSIPLELIYFAKKSSSFPYRWVLLQFSAFIVLCGATHLINLWTFTMHTKTVDIVMTVAKVTTAIVSCVTALTLIHIIPDLLGVKTRELFLKKKANELDREMGLMPTQEETGRHVRMLTHEIRSTLDRHTILKTALVGLGRTLGLEECAFWMPSQSGSSLELTHTLRHQIPAGLSVQINLPVVNQIFSTNQAITVPHTSPLATIRPVQGRHVPLEVAAMRIPLLHLSNFQPEHSAKSFAIMILMLPSDSARKWLAHELKLVEVIADQVAIALSHAAILEESRRARDLLTEQNVTLDLALREAEMAIHARNVNRVGVELTWPEEADNRATIDSSASAAKVHNADPCSTRLTQLRQIPMLLFYPTKVCVDPNPTPYLPLLAPPRCPKLFPLLLLLQHYVSEPM